MIEFEVAFVGGSDKKDSESIRMNVIESNGTFQFSFLLRVGGNVNLWKEVRRVPPSINKSILEPFSDVFEGSMPP